MHLIFALLLQQGVKETAAVVDNLRRNIPDKKRVGELLSSLISKKYPRGAEAVTFDELLQWDLWPSFIKIYGTYA